MDKSNQNNTGEIYNSEYKELVDFLVVKFGNIDKKFEEMNSNIDAVKADVRTVSDRVVRLSDKVDDYHAEQIGLKHQVNKHEKWHFRVANKVGVDLAAD